MRGKQVLAESKRLFDTAVPADFFDRMPAVQRALYLLFNEGYHGASTETSVRSVSSSIWCTACNTSHDAWSQTACAAMALPNEQSCQMSDTGQTGN
jgi:hypothetical protein